MTSSIDVKALQKLLDGNSALHLLDVRRKSDFATAKGAIAGARWRDPEQIDQWLPTLPDDAITVVYCVRGGSVSQSVTQRLRQAGLEARFLEGGFQAWADQGRQVEPISKTINHYKLQTEDIDLLRQTGVSEEDIAHSLKVAQKAIEIAGRCPRPLDMTLVGRGALFHDLGKARTHDMEHGLLGAQMGAALGLPETITAVMEKHIRGGLTAAEATELGLPVKDYTLYLLEERIVIYADRLVDIITDGIVAIQDESEAETRFEEVLRTIPKYGKNALTLERYLGYHREIQQFPRP